MTETDYVFDMAGRMTGMTHFKGGTTLGDYDWAFDAAGRMTGFDSAADGSVAYANRMAP